MMALDIKKCVNAAKLPVVPIVLLDVLMVAMVLAMAATVLPSIVGIIVLIMCAIAILLVLAWAGLRAVKQYGMDLAGGALTGLMAGLGSALAFGVILILGSVIDLLQLSASLDSGKLTATIGVIALAVALAIMIAIAVSVVMGAIMGVIGAFVAQMKK
ncbi:MAG: hypothetical protein PHF60_04690 [Candidatus ainarchaeum sp.]|nr:hypothetical protein [Candidatus ainarchaeum sp.]